MKLTPERIAKKEPLVILDSRGFHLRVGSDWHHGLTREQARRLLWEASIDGHDICLLLDSAMWWPEPMEATYQPTGRRRWLVDGRPVTRDGAAWVYRRVGMTHKEIRCLMRIQQLCYEIEARRPPPPPDTMTVEEFRCLLADGLAHALSLRVARHWIRDHLRGAQCKHPLGLAGWKERFERDKPKRSIAQEKFAQALNKAKIPVIGEDVYCEEVQA